MATRIVRGQKVNQRKMRAPHNNFHIKTRPWQIQPFCIFPVLPGETMQNAMWKSRVVSDPVTEPDVEEVILFPPADKPVFHRIGNNARLPHGVLHGFTRQHRENAEWLNCQGRVLMWKLV